LIFRPIHCLGIYRLGKYFHSSDAGDGSLPMDAIQETD